MVMDLLAEHLRHDQGPPPPGDMKALAVLLRIHARHQTFGQAAIFLDDRALQDHVTRDVGAGRHTLVFRRE